MPTYDAAFFDYVNTTAADAAQRVVPTLNAALRPDSMLDVGCGQGAWVAAWRSLGVRETVGIDGSYIDPQRLLIPTHCFTAVDLARGFDLGRRFDFLQCLEVAEHVPADCADVFLDSLARHSSIILFSAAPPGQGGHDHVNERSYEYWRRQFAHRRYVACDFLRPQILHDPHIAVWYRYNPVLYVHEEQLTELPASVIASRVPDSTPVPDLAPLRYRLRRQIVRRFPVPLMTLLARLKERIFGRKARTARRRAS